MADYPNSIYTPRERENKAGVEYNADRKTVLFVEDVELGDDETIAVETELGLLPKGSDASVRARLDRMDDRPKMPTTEPSSPVDGMFWYDYGETAFKIYYSGQWVVFLAV